MSRTHDYDELLREIDPEVLAAIDEQIAKAYEDDDSERPHVHGQCFECRGPLNEGMTHGTCGDCKAKMPRPTIVARDAIKVLYGLAREDRRRRPCGAPRRSAHGARRPAGPARRRRRAATRSSAKSGDSGSDGPGDAGPHLTIVRSRAIYNYAVLSRSERGETS